ncbi:MAG: JAB domain-containing protein [Oscillospiraceae bacterium]|nr:JAB domain-containing protein [Oscillospiraceae bacterium]
MPDHPHGGHRKRLKNQYNVSGSEGMSDFTFLELMLFFAVPQGDTNPLAHRLIEKFGSFDRVLDAKFEELMSVDGVGEHTATYLTLYQAAMKRYVSEKTVTSFRTTDTELIESFVRSKYINTPNERAMLLHFNADGNFVNYTWLGDGSFEKVSFDNRIIAASIVENKTKMVITVHNHPSGIAAPSEGDKRALKDLADFLRMMNVTLVDNLIITKNGSHFFSKHSKYTDFLISCYLGANAEN